MLHAQPPAKDRPPELPEVRIEGQPQALPEGIVPPTDFPSPVGGIGEAPLSAGGIFASPLADGYVAPSATTGTIVNVPQIDFPGTISIVPQAVIQDQQAIRVDDVLRDISSAIKFGDFRRPDAFTVRGFEVRSRDFRWNGFLDPSSSPRDFANIQRFEVLQGPASVLYGGGQPAGVVNVITKKPQADTFGVIDYQFGSFGLNRTTLDATGAVSADGRLLYRITAAYQDISSFRDFGFNERTFVDTAFTYLLDDNNALNFEFQYLNDRRRFDTGLAAINGQVGVLPISRFLGEPHDFQRYNDYKTSVWFTHRFNEDWSGRIGFFSTWYDNPSYGTVPIDLSLIFGSPILPGGVVARQIQDTPFFREQYYSIMADIAGTCYTGPFQHKIVAGTELGWFNSTDFTTYLSDPIIFIPPFTVLPSSAINVFNPVYGLPQPPTPGHFDADFSQERYGFFVQDLIDITPRWKLLAGVRYDIAVTSFARELEIPIGGGLLGTSGFPRVQTDANYYRLSPRVGLIYQPIQDVLSIYSSYSQSFDPPPGGNFRNPEPLLPETGQSIEAGFKADLLDKHLSISAAGFYITKQNVVTQDTLFFAQQIGEQRSQGAEISIIGRLTDAWSILANYAYVDSRITDDPDPFLVGHRFRGVPYNSANLWTRYNVIQNQVHTLGLALGLVYVGDRVGDLADTFQLPSYARWDAGVYYQRRNLTASLYLENIFDRQYYAGSVDSLAVFPGAPFNVRAQVGVRW